MSSDLNARSKTGRRIGGIFATLAGTWLAGNVLRNAERPFPIPAQAVPDSLRHAEVDKYIHASSLENAILYLAENNKDFSGHYLVLHAGGQAQLMIAQDRDGGPREDESANKVAILEIDGVTTPALEALKGLYKAHCFDARGPVSKALDHLMIPPKVIVVKVPGEAAPSAAPGMAGEVPLLGLSYKVYGASMTRVLQIGLSDTIEGQSRRAGIYEQGVVSVSRFVPEPQPVP